ncbi:MAG: sporulation transcription factor Spo0A [Clostridia bacterium]|jgi:two-component system response regulator (stage 0 sporulation protein A)|nr:sporulation transcription factor Spo0A [Clostridia bacterium]MDD4408555.1 sporulation transcription factor Spo0A [Clostridia bacterium]
MENSKSENKKINLFIADNADESRADFISHFKDSEKFIIAGQSKDGNETLKALSQSAVDVLIMDIVLTGIDGFEFLEKAKKELGNKLPKIIITSSLSHNGFIEKALSLGVSYFMIKPIQMKSLENRINDILGLGGVGNSNPIPKQNFKNMRTKIIEEKISNVFITVGIPAHIKGYQFLREAIKMAIDKPDIINSITKRLYPSIANKFETSSSKVERAIRHAIEVAWNRGKIENINNLFGIKVYNQNEKPTNGEFIALVADKMLMESIGD